jgi:diaminopimelate dehydrogenase
MSNLIKVGIVGFGNIGKGVQQALAQNPDFSLSAIFTRRDPLETSIGEKAVHISHIKKYKGEIDVMVLCGGSATDLPEQTPEIAEDFNTLDSFDNHNNIPDYFNRLDEVAKKSGTLSLISSGWDPGLFSINRLLGQAILPHGQDYTFWGEGVSQGHSDAVRRIEGVKLAIQYTVPIKSAIDAVRRGSNIELTQRERHERICFVVPKPDADQDKIKDTIVNMPSYFVNYNTTVNFITEEEFTANHLGMPHGGFVIRTGITGQDTLQRMEFSLDLGSNPQFTASIMVAFARAVHRLSREGQTGARTVFDIPLGYLSPKSPRDLRKEIL